MFESILTWVVENVENINKKPGKKKKEERKTLAKGVEVRILEENESKLVIISTGLCVDQHLKSCCEE